MKMKILLDSVAYRCINTLICVSSFGKWIRSELISLYFIQNSWPRGIRTVRLPNSSLEKLESCLFTMLLHQMKLVLINSGIPKFILHIQWLLLKARSQITNAQTAPLSRVQASHIFSWGWFCYQSNLQTRD